MSVEVIKTDAANCYRKGLPTRALPVKRSAQFKEA